MAGRGHAASPRITNYSLKEDSLVKSRELFKSSFRPRIKCGINCIRARSEASAPSSDFNTFWMPDHDFLRIHQRR
jgi:hypothetical protein